MRLSLILPVYNEAALLEPVVTALARDLTALEPDFEIVLSENGSTDGSAGLADRLAAADARVRVIHAAQADYGFALQRGLAAGQGERLAHFSVDLVDLDFLRTALGLLGEVDVVLGSKHLAAGSDRRDWVRRLGGGTFHWMARAILGLPVQDTHGIKAFRRAAVAPLIAACTHGGGLFDDELILRAHRAGLRLREIPVAVREVRPSRRGIVMLALRALLGLVRLRLSV